MARELVALKVKIGMKPTGGALYPDFNQLQIVKDSKMDWAIYIDMYSDGKGWHYDKMSGHKDDTIDSPIGQQFGMMLLPELFVTQATAMFPDVCFKLTELECEVFYNEKAHIKDQDEIFDNKILDSIKLKQDLNIELTDTQLAALNPSDPTPGIITNKNKIWIDHKQEVNITIKKD